MKTMNISLMVVGMMILGTTTSFGRTNKVQSRESNKNTPRQEFRVENNRDGQREMKGGNHDGRTYKMQPVEHRVQPQPQPQPQPVHPVEVRPGHVNPDVVTGVVVGSVVTGILSSLIH